MKVTEIQKKIDALMAEHSKLALADLDGTEKERAGLVKKMDRLTEDLQKASK